MHTDGKQTAKLRNLDLNKNPFLFANKLNLERQIALKHEKEKEKEKKVTPLCTLKVKRAMLLVCFSFARQIPSHDCTYIAVHKAKESPQKVNTEKC